MEERQVTIRKKHQILLKDRENLSLDGVTNVESFDDTEIVLETDAGILVVRGENLHIKEFNLNNATLNVDGFITSLEYTGDTVEKRGRGFLSKLFK